MFPSSGRKLSWVSDIIIMPTCCCAHGKGHNEGLLISPR